MKKLFFILVCLTLFAPFYVTQELTYPFITSKALFFRLVVILILPVYVYLVFRDKTLRPHYKNPVNGLLILFLAVNFVSAFSGTDRTRSLWGNFERMGGVVNLLSLVLVYFYLQALAALNPAWFKNFLKLFAASGIAAAAYGLWTYAGLPGFFVDASLPARAASFFGNPIFFASFLVIPAFLAAFFGWQAYGKRQRVLWFSGAILQLCGIYVSGTRGAVVGLLAGLLVGAVIYLVFSPSKKIKLLGLGGLAGLVILAGLLAFLSPRLPQNSLLRRVSNLNDSNTKARLIQWQSALKGFKDRPLLGTGPENYYVVANKYFNPAIYQYDSSWFDKPHNYQLELLVTIGISGLLVYLALVAAGVWLLWKAFKKNLLDLFSFVLLLGGFTAYQVQNLFVFDTLSAALAFFIFLAFLGWLWGEIFQVSPSQVLPTSPNPSYDKEGNKNKGGKRVGVKQRFTDNTLAAAAAVIAGALAIYAIIFLVVGSYRVMRDLNYGVALGVSDIPAAQKYFEQSFTPTPQQSLVWGFNFDPGETGVKFTEFIIQVAQDYREKLDIDFVNQLMQSGIDRLALVAAKVGNNPIYWYQLANLYTTKTYINNQNNAEADYSQAEDAAQRAVALAPNRIEPKYFLVPILTVQRKYQQAIEVSQNILKDDPWSPEAKWRLSLVYQDAGRHADALILAEQALKEGYHFKLAREARWLINANVEAGNYVRAAELYEQIIALSPNDYQLYANLAAVYAKLGQKQKAIDLANKVLQLQPAAKADVDAFIKSLQ